MLEGYTKARLDRDNAMKDNAPGVKLPWEVQDGDPGKDRKAGPAKDLGAEGRNEALKTPEARDSEKDGNRNAKTSVREQLSKLGKPAETKETKAEKAVKAQKEAISL